MEKWPMTSSNQTFKKPMTPIRTTVIQRLSTLIPILSGITIMTVTPGSGNWPALLSLLLEVTGQVADNILLLLIILHLKKAKQSVSLVLIAFDHSSIMMLWKKIDPSIPVPVA
jgi:hypothetical protein